MFLTILLSFISLLKILNKNKYVKNFQLKISLS